MFPVTVLLYPTAVASTPEALFEYPSASVFVSMVKNPEYREAVKHRQLAVKDSRLIRMAPLSVGENFGE